MARPHQTRQIDEISMRDVVNEIDNFLFRKRKSGYTNCICLLLHYQKISGAELRRN